MSNDWRLRHAAALISPVDFEVVGRMIEDWIGYGEAYRLRYESPISEDYFLGSAWIKIGDGLLDMLNGDLGRLEGGPLDGLIRNALNDQGYDPDTLKIKSEQVAGPWKES